MPVEPIKSAFFGIGENGHTHAPGWFLFDDENCVRITVTFSHNMGNFVNRDEHYIPAGTYIPDYHGIVYEDVDVSDGAAPGSLVIEGKYYADRIFNGPISDEPLLVNVGNYPIAIRPDFSGEGE